MQKWYPKSDQNGLQKGPQKRAKITKMGSKSATKRGFQQNMKKSWFSTPPHPSGSSSGCSESSIFTFWSDVSLAPFWLSFWRCFGSPNGGQGHQKATSRKHQKMVPKMSPTWSQRGSQNGAKIVKNEVLEAPCFKGGSQVASRAPPGLILERFWDPVFLIFVWWVLHTFFSSMLQTKAFNFSRHHQNNATESFQETASRFVPSCIEKFTSEH